MKFYFNRLNSKRTALFCSSLVVANLLVSSLYAQEVVDVDPSIINQVDMFFESPDSQPSDKAIATQKNIASDAPTSGNAETATIRDVAAESLKQEQLVKNTKIEPVSDQEKLADSITSDVAKLKTDLKSKDSKLKEILDKMQKMQARLHLAEVENQRLSKMLDNSNQQVLKEYSDTTVSNKTSNMVSPQLASQGASINRESYHAAVRPLQPSSSKEMMVATVVVEKANLRTGPGKNNSPMMSVSKGTRLAIETRLGEWYRVITPTGTRAWVSSDVVAFGNKINSKPNRVVKVRGYDNEAFSLEDEARALINKMQKQ